MDGAEESDYSGRTVSKAGDVNGDGLGDVIVNGPGSDSSNLVFGKTSGFDATLALSSLDGTVGFRLESYGSGSSVSNAGDVNGDGFDDVIVGSYNDASYVVFEIRLITFSGERMSTSADTLGDARLIEHFVFQMDERQHDFITQCFCLGNKSIFGGCENTVPKQKLFSSCSNCRRMCSATLAAS